VAFLAAFVKFFTSSCRERNYGSSYTVFKKWEEEREEGGREGSYLFWLKFSLFLNYCRFEVLRFSIKCIDLLVNILQHNV
jgi:hypothetical protein